MRPGSARNSSVSKPRSTRSVSRPIARPVAPSSSADSSATASSPWNRRTACSSPRASRRVGSDDRTSVSSRSSGPSSVSERSLPRHQRPQLDVELRHDAVRIGERDAAARDVEACCRRDRPRRLRAGSRGPTSDGLGDGAAHAQRRAGLEAAVVVVEPQILLREHEQIQPQPLGPARVSPADAGGRERRAASSAGRLIVSL